jgi:rubredoxin
MDSLPFQYQKREFWEFYCPVCKIERRSFYWPSPRRKHYFALFILAFFMTSLVGFFFGPSSAAKSIFLILPIWALFEFFYRAKARQSLICPSCGFDPYLYKYDVQLAREKVKQFFDAKEKLRREKTTQHNQGLEGKSLADKSNESSSDDVD